MLKIFVCAAAAVLLLPSCTKSQYILYENDIVSKAYFPIAERNPLIEVSPDDLDENGCYQLCIYNAGNNSGEITVDVAADEYALKVYSVETGTDYRLLPAEYWSLLKSSYTLDTGDNRQAFMSVQLDIAGFDAAGLPAEEYLLPLSLYTGDQANLSYDLKTVYIKLSL